MTEQPYPVRDVWDLPARHIGRRVLVYDRIDSTNTRALQLAEQGENEGLALLADAQELGRGQHGRRWLATPRSSVLLSVVLFAPPELSRPVVLTAWAATAVCRVVAEATGRTPRIKWPNDVLVEDRKVCGILIEQSRSSRGPATVVGIGLNVAQSAAELLAADLPEATSLAALGASGADTHRVARWLLACLDESYDQLIGGHRQELRDAWRAGLDLVGSEVVVELLGGTRVGRLLELDFDGLVLNKSDGTVQVILPEAVLHIRQC